MFGFGRQSGMNQETEDPEPIVHRDYDDTELGEIVAVLTRFRCRTCHETATVDPHHHRKLLGVCRRPNVQGQAVLASSWIRKNHVSVDSTLHAVSTELRSLAHRSPFCCGGGWFPAQLSDRRCSIPNAEKSVDAVFRLTFDNSVGSRNLRTACLSECK